MSPYIPQSRRDTAPAQPELPGDLHYDISQLIDGYLYHQPGQNIGPDYRRFNDVMGVLACAQAEVYRRLIAPYEDEAIKRNGDVYSGDHQCQGCIEGNCGCSE